MGFYGILPSGKRSHNYGTSAFWMEKKYEKLIISMAIFNSSVKLPEGNGDNFVHVFWDQELRITLDYPMHSWRFWWFIPTAKMVNSGMVYCWFTSIKSVGLSGKIIHKCTKLFHDEECWMESCLMKEWKMMRGTKSQHAATIQQSSSSIDHTKFCIVAYPKHVAHDQGIFHFFLWIFQLAMFDWWVGCLLLSSDWQGAKELGVFIFPTYSLLNGEPRCYLEFPNHLID